MFPVCGSSLCGLLLRLNTLGIFHDFEAQDLSATLCRGFAMDIDATPMDHSVEVLGFTCSYGCSLESDVIDCDTYVNCTPLNMMSVWARISEPKQNWN